MPIIRKSRAFKDISLSFKPHPVTKDLPILINERAIIRSVRNLVETIPTERFFNPDIGSDIRDSLFENFHPTLQTIIEDQIIETITNYEPRVENINVQLDPYTDQNAFDVTVFFDVVGLDIPTVSFTFLLEPTR
ncbi:MAG: hypothetical protein CMC69_01850 [Flavobacteriaceae bacterium]|nr:hypothetical protein [Flavobacteriaceae bacterium]|tara:strand:+ start:1399 stop:1800 length:402 start_codon:yes stop_codon:yes gene_type:complete